MLAFCPEKGYYLNIAERGTKTPSQNKMTNYKIYTFVMTDHKGNGRYEENKDGVELFGKTKEELIACLERRFDTFHSKKPYLEFI
jgi:hypothetical protein